MLFAPEPRLEIGTHDKTVHPPSRTVRDSRAFGCTWVRGWCNSCLHTWSVPLGGGGRGGGGWWLRWWECEWWTSTANRSNCASSIHRRTVGAGWPCTRTGTRSVCTGRYHRWTGLFHHRHWIVWQGNWFRPTCRYNLRSSHTTIRRGCTGPTCSGECSADSRCALQRWGHVWDGQSIKWVQLTAVDFVALVVAVEQWIASLVHVDALAITAREASARLVICWRGNTSAL